MKKGLLIASTLILSCTSYAAYAQVQDKVYKDWTVYTTMLDGKKTCYMGSFPKSKKGNYTKRDEPYALVTRVAKGVHEISVTSGYKYKKNSQVSFNIDGTNYNLSPDGEVAWTPDPQNKRDAIMIEKMKKGNKLTVRGTSIKGTYSEDRYSLSGFTAAFNRIQTLCK